jgi:hypothetical protein
VEQTTSDALVTGFAARLGGIYRKYSKKAVLRMFKPNAMNYYQKKNVNPAMDECSRGRA